MKQYALALIASVASLSTYAQNLVPNPSFEEYLECPQSTGELDQQVVDWVSWHFTPDFFHVCNNDGLGSAGVPNNGWGNQMPISGDAYTGVYTYAEYAPDIREYMASQLETPLTMGNTYYMMFHASLYDGGQKQPRWCETNNIGMRFFKDPTYTAFPPDANPLEPDNFAHLNYSEILDDYTNWTLIEGWFTADEDYNWVAIGNFFTDDQTEITILNDEGACSGIYYIENVCVASSPEECDYLLSADANKTAIKANVYPNPATESVRFSLPEKDEYTVVFFDAQGRMISNFKNIRTGKEINVSTFQKGVYVVRVYNNHFFTTLKLIIK
jgi:hypothetical protein